MRVEGQHIPDDIVARIEDLMRAGPFDSHQLTQEATRLIIDRSVVKYDHAELAYLLVSRLIQNHRIAGRLSKEAGGSTRYATWTWIGPRAEGELV